MTEVEVERAAKYIWDTLNIDGLPPTEDNMEMCRQILKGEVSVEEALKGVFDVNNSGRHTE